MRSTDGFREADWPEALDHVEDRIRHIQTQYGRDAFALLSGASLTNEKAYLIGKFARLALRTRHIDYNGRLCMVSAGAANRMAFGIDRGGQPWSDIPLAKCLILAGINVGECFPILTDYIWRARDNGARIIVIDPRMTPIARTADLLLPVRPGRDSALMNGLLHVCIARGWIDHAFIAQHTQGFEKVRRLSPPTLQSMWQRSPACRQQPLSRRQSGGAQPPQPCSCTPAALNITPRARKTVWRASTWYWPLARLASRAAGTRLSPVREWPGRAGAWAAV